MLAVAPESSQPVLHRTLARFSVMDRFETLSGLQSPLKPQPQYSLYTLTFENCDPSQQGYADTAKSCDKKDRLSRSRSRDNVFTHRKYRSLGDSDAGDGGRHKSSSWNRGADIREAVLMLEGQRVEAAFQRASRLS
ncbi:hypothetical protein BGX23_000280 [Mortierella sp. AD031]|nr:hypothetical protein BGX23_000280 [Mortierella sp. AD031]